MKLETGTITIGEFHDAYVSGLIKPYKNNRGGLTHNKGRIHKYAKNWDTASSGDVVVEKVKDGYILRDFHARAEAIRLGMKSGTINKKDTLLIRVLPPGDGITAYKNINAAKSHTAIEKLNNDDLAFGCEINKILAKTDGFSEQDPCPPKFYQHIARSITDLKYKQREQAVLSRDPGSFINRYKDCVAGTDDADAVKLSANQIAGIARAIDYYGLVRDAARKGCSQKNQTDVVEKLTNSSILFGFIIFDFMFKRILEEPTTLGANIATRYRKVDDKLRMLAMGTMSDRLRSTAEFNTILIGK